MEKDHSEPEAPKRNESDVYDRQIRLWGAEAQVSAVEQDRVEPGNSRCLLVEARCCYGLSRTFLLPILLPHFRRPR